LFFLLNTVDCDLSIIIFHFKAGSPLPQCFVILSSLYVLNTGGISDTSCEEYGQSCTASQHICRYGGTCVNLPAGARCTCAPGFTGKYCEVNVADCAEVDCGNGRCYDLVASYLCVCQGGWRGESCSLCICLVVVCPDDSFPVSYSGVGCDISEQQCSPSPCLRGAQCVDSGGSFQCLCPAGFTGRVCETDINECQGQILSARLTI